MPVHLSLLVLRSSRSLGVLVLALAVAGRGRRRPRSGPGPGAEAPAPSGAAPPGAAPPESGQATAEYALVLLGAAVVAIALVTWATRSGRIGQLFDAVFDELQGRL